MYNIIRVNILELIPNYIIIIIKIILDIKKYILDKYIKEKYSKKIIVIIKK